VTKRIPPPSPDDLADAFARLFSGLPRAHGRYLVPAGAAPGRRGKVEGKAWTSKHPVNHLDWVAHLSGDLVTVKDGDDDLTGTLSLGVTPIRDDATCVFGAIDVDVYPLDLPALQRDVVRLGLPLVACRTKSGGAHLYLFMTEDAPAETVRNALMGWSVLLGHPGVEVFPKQTRLAGPNDDGSWINLPYAGGELTVRYALDPADAHALTAAEFVALADGTALSLHALETLEPNLPAGPLDDVLAGAPPCLVVLARVGFGEGHRNNALFNLGVYLRKRYGDGFKEHLESFNHLFMDPPLPAREVIATQKSLLKKDYNYRCRDQPISQVCNRQVCLGCEFGVGGGKDDPGVVLGELVKLETSPPTWLWDVNGARLELSTVELMDQRAFQARCLEVLHVWPALVKPMTWQGIVRERLGRLQLAPVPDDATREGQLWEQLGRFCTSRVVGRSLDELLLGKPWTGRAEGMGPEEAPRTFFRSVDLLQYLQQQRFGNLSERDLYRFLKRRMVEHHFFNLKGKGVNCWSVPALQQQTQEFDVPRAAVADEM
jgi:hypothetical protein